MQLSTIIQNDYTIKLPVFEGPLDLLLHLIREHKLDIYDIPIAEVADQYLEYLSLMESLNLDIAGEFFVVAATLLEIKSRMLLPAAPKEEESEEGSDPRAELVEKLLEYEKFKNMSYHFLELEANRQKMFWRSTDEINDYDAPMIHMDVEAMDLLFALQRMLSEADDENEVTSIEKQKINLRMKMREIWNRIKSAGEAGTEFTALFEENKRSRIEIVMAFISILELLKLGRIRVKQRKPLDKIFIWAIINE